MTLRAKSLIPLSPSKPQLLNENTGLAFIGETLWPVAQLSARQAKSFNDAANPTGRPNADVIRRFVGVESGRTRERAQIDFPSHFTGQEAGLYLKPFSHLRRAEKKNSPQPSWFNPCANSALRTAIARLDRYFATPLAAKNPAWDWIESDRLPDASLLAVARDDDFIHGLLQSRFFCSWWHAWSRSLSPPEIVQTFPFPWPPATLLSALTRIQEEHRLAIARAVRSGEQSSLDAAVVAAYAGSAEMTDQEIVNHLENLNHRRATSGAA